MKTTRLLSCIAVLISGLAETAYRAEALVSATGGNTTNYIGGYCIQTPTSGSNNFVVTTGGNIEVLVVAGGGGGGKLGAELAGRCQALLDERVYGLMRSGLYGKSTVFPLLVLANVLPDSDDRLYALAADATRRAIQ